MLIIGLTGSIGMGKSTAAARFRSHGIAVFDADAAVHRLYAGKAVPLIEAAFPGTTNSVSKTVDRPLLAAALIADPSGFKRLEAIVHPLVQAEQREFLQEQAAAGADMAVLEIPLLLETGGEARVDIVVVVSAPPDVQRQRVLARPGITEERLQSLLARQMPDAEKRAKAHFVVDTSGTIEASQAQIDTIIAKLRGRPGTALERHWS
ncbi:MAG: dephospho-CoA kinase [Hyphomicrobiaceae bacterium]